MDKRTIRQRLLKQRNLLSREDCRRLSSLAQQQLSSSDCFQRATSVALYSSINNEVQTEQLFAAAEAQGKRICYPRVRGGQLDFVQIETLDNLQHGSFGVAEPAVGIECPIEKLDLIVVPGVAFDRHGVRLGYGQGFYDRELSRAGAATLTVGLCFDFQLCASLPVEEHDRPVHYLATESQFIPCDNAVAGSP